jgi:hypothetical protein
MIREVKRKEMEELNQDRFPFEQTKGRRCGRSMLALKITKRAMGRDEIIVEQSSNQ